MSQYLDAPHMLRPLLFLLSHPGGRAVPNIVQSSLTDNELYLKSSTGSEITVTKAEILAYHNTLAGSDPDLTKTRVKSHFADVISSALGSANVQPDQIDLDYDTATGRPTELTVYS